MRAGELYEREIFSRVPDGHGKAPRFTDDLKIVPLGEDDFSPKDHNWRRSAKVPILILNATSLNTGHNWQFTVSFLGEPPGAIVDGIDSNERLRRLYYEQAPERRKSGPDRVWSLLANDFTPRRRLRGRIRSL